MTTKRDIGILIECYEKAKAKRDALAVEIVEWCIKGHDITGRQIKEYNAAQLGVESTRRDLENCTEIAAITEMEEYNAKAHE